MKQIRNFAIIAHVDHGKSTLADRLLEMSGLVVEAEEQTLDSNPIERERGITISLAPVQMPFEVDGVAYIFNLVDTPGHVDFTYEVNRALAACEGAILLVDATQGVQAQTLAHWREAHKLGLTIIPVVNKVDLPSAEIEETMLQMMEVFEIEEGEIIQASGKTGIGTKEIIRAVVDRIPAPQGDENKAARALVFNSDYLPHQGVRLWIRVVDGRVERGTNLFASQANIGLNTQELGVFQLKSVDKKSLETGDVGYLISGLKDPRKVKPGETLVLNTTEGKAMKALPGYRPPQPMVFLSFYPIEAQDYDDLGKALDRLSLHDASIRYTTESSTLLGQGYRVGFLGLLHAEVVQERLEREFNLDVFATTPTVPFEILTVTNEVVEIENPNQLPDPSVILEIREPILLTTILVPSEYLGGVIPLLEESRAEVLTMDQAGRQVKMVYKLPLLEMVSGFYARLKTITSGYASLDYEPAGREAAKLVKLDILLAGDVIPVLAQIVPREKVEEIGKRIVEKITKVIPRHNFEIAVQAAVGGKIVARSTIKAFRKDVTAKLYGGDQTRKDKLLNKQKKGKKKMKSMGKVNVPPDAFRDLLS